MRYFIRRAAAILLSAAFVFTMQIFAPIKLSAEAEFHALWPTEPEFKNITTYFEPQRNNGNMSYHNAIDIEADGNSDIYAVYGGEVVSAEWKGDYGNMVIIYHPDLNVYTFYAHANYYTVSTGDEVKQGDLIAKVGSTGHSSGNHLHYGICDTLVGGYPSVMYYDPLTYFTYSDSDGNQGQTAVQEYSEEYAGRYTTKDVDTYLNIRLAGNTSASVIGEIPPDAEFTVLKGNGKWAQVDYNGIRGYSSMTFMQRIEDVRSEMRIENVKAPSGTIEAGKAFILRGVIASNLKITKVYGGIYLRSGEATSQYAEAAPNSLKYDLSSYFDRVLVFEALGEGAYTYKIFAEDSGGESYQLVCSDFVLSSEVYNGLMGDLSGDGKLNVSDVVLLQEHLLNKSGEFSKKQFLASDLNEDGFVDVFDLIELKKAVIKATE